jgi:hypothetical protein
MSLADGFLVGLCQGEIVATVMFGYDGHRGSVNYLAVTPRSKSGLGPRIDAGGGGATGLS